MVLGFAAGCAGGDGTEGAAPSWPGPESAGVPAGTTLAPLHGETALLATPGEVVDGKDVTGCLAITAGPSTIRRVRAGGCAREAVISVCGVGNVWHDGRAPLEP